MTWNYEADPRRKHKRGWDETFAGFVTEAGGEVVGKCPADMSMQKASELLNDPEAVHERPERWEREYPKSILNIESGVLYRATWTNPGVSCHGFPEIAERAEKLPKAVKNQLIELAKKRNCEESIRSLLAGKSQ